MFRYTFPLALTLSLLASPVFSQDLIEHAPLRDKFDPVNWDEVSLPPSDPYTLLYEPARPENALDIANEFACHAKNGEWAVEKHLSNAGLSQPYSIYGCQIDGKAVGRWIPVPNDKQPGRSKDNRVLLTQDMEMGYVWFVDDKKQGEATIYQNHKEHGKFLAAVMSFDNDLLDGPSMAWGTTGILTMYHHYKAGKKHGTGAEFDDHGKPQYVVQFDEDNPVGVWSLYHFLTGGLEFKKDYTKVAPEALNALIGDHERLVWVEKYDAMGSGGKLVEGFTLERIDDNPTEIGSYIGTQTFYDANGEKWLDVQFKRDAVLSDPLILQLCQSYDDFNFDHNTRSVACLNEDSEPMRVVRFYPTGEIRYIEERDSAQSALWLHEERHKDGKPMTAPAKYKLKRVDDVEIPEETVTFLASTEYAQKNGIEAYGTSNVTHGTGKWTAYWANGKIRESGEFSDYAKNNEWSYYTEHGAMYSREHYKNGVKHGLFETWYDDGMPDQVSSFKNGSRDGVFRGYYTMGGIGWELSYKMGRFSGEYREYSGTGVVLKVEDFVNVKIENGETLYPITLYYPNGNVRAKGYDSEIKNEKDGTWQLYLNDGTFWREVEFKDDVVMSRASFACREQGGEYVIDEEKREEGCYMPLVNREVETAPQKSRNGRWRWWDERGALQREGTLILGHFYGTWSYYYPGGKPGVDPDDNFLMLRGDFDCDRPVGKWTGYYRNQKKKFDGAYNINGKEDGIWTTYFENGQKASEGAYKDGLHHGKWTWYHDNGQLRDQGEFVDDLETGVWTSFHANGQKAGEGAYKAGKRDGVWTWWRENGELWKSVTYVDGVDQSMKR